MWVWYHTHVLCCSFTHPHRHAHRDTHRHAQTHRDTETQTQTQTHTDTHTQIHTHTHTHTQTHRHTHTHADTDTDTQSDTETHTQTTPPKRRTFPPSTVYVFPVPVCPYAMMDPLYPSSTDSTTGLMALSYSDCCDAGGV